MDRQTTMQMSVKMLIGVLRQAQATWLTSSMGDSKNKTVTLVHTLKLSQELPGLCLTLDPKWISAQ